jgi:7-carboxy-7-deazaguanine synthase
MIITEIFKSIQGETSYVGIPFVFIRTTGCNLRCHWCDTKYAFDEGTEMSLPEILRRVDGYQTNHVLVTGGEPLLQEEVYPLFQSLVERGLTTLVETSGSIGVERLAPQVVKILDIKCPASGMTHHMDWKNLDHLTPRDEIKFVIQNREDYLWAKNIFQSYPQMKGRVILFAPVYGMMEPSLLAEWVLKDNLPVRLQLQMHKMIWGAETRGV